MGRNCRYFSAIVHLVGDANSDFEVKLPCGAFWDVLQV